MVGLTLLPVTQEPVPIAKLVLSLIGPVLMLVLLSLLVRRGLYKRFPVFFVYSLSILIITLVRFLGVGKPLEYFFVYWSTEAFYLVIACLAMLSVLKPLTQLEYVRHPWSRFMLFPLLVLIVASSLSMAMFKPIAKAAAGRFASGVYVFIILMCLAELLLFIVSFNSRRRAIQWSQYELGILTGFGALTSLNLIAYFALVLRLFRFNVGPQLEQIFQAFPVGAFIASAVVWVIAFWRPEPPRPESPDIGRFLDALNVVLEQYQAQAEFLKRVARHLGLQLVIPKHS